MRERPVLFSGPMVQAILADRKTQTRRLISPQPKIGPELAQDVAAAWEAGFIDVRCPYGAPGDRLWVRETHFRWGRWVRNGKTKSGRQAWRFRAITHPFEPDVVFTLPEGAKTVARRGHYGWHRRPSIFLERRHARLTLDVTEVRVQRLQEISEEDARAEGVEQVEIMLQCGRTGLRWKDYEDALALATPLQSFLTLWSSINGHREGASWAENPWVWAITFRRVEEA